MQSSRALSGQGAHSDLLFRAERQRVEAVRTAVLQPHPLAHAAKPQGPSVNLLALGAAAAAAVVAAFWGEQQALRLRFRVSCGQAWVFIVLDTAQEIQCAVQAVESQRADLPIPEPLARQLTLLRVRPRRLLWSSAPGSCSPDRRPGSAGGPQLLPTQA